MSQPLVTISIPLYNCEAFLEKCLDSVRFQTYSNIEVSLINDQTPDNSVAIAEEYIQRHQLTNWEIVHLERNCGLSVVRNKGIDTANGKYLFFMDSDDVISADCISRLVEVGERTSAQMTVSQIQCERQGTEEKVFCLGRLQQEEPLLGNDKVFLAFARGEIPSSAVNKLFLVEFFRKNKVYFIPGLFAQDELWTFHSCLKLESVAFQREITYTYYLHDKSVIHNRGKRNFDNWQTIAEYIDRELKNAGNSERRILIRKYLVKYKDMTMQMNWRAQHNETMWKESYRNYQKLSSLRFIDYFSKQYSLELKKKSLLLSLPVGVGMWVFKKRWGK